MKKQDFSFKPCYKWNTFNTNIEISNRERSCSFKPCYKWNTFNTMEEIQKLMEILEF